MTAEAALLALICFFLYLGIAAAIVEGPWRSREDEDGEWPMESGQRNRRGL